MITDDTLREGLQTPGISFTQDEKLKIAGLLKKAGIRRALVSYPPAHDSEKEITARIVEGKYFDEVYGLGRTVRKDVDTIDETGANISMHLPFSIDGLEEILDTVKYASGKGKIVEVAVVDMVKFSENELLKISRSISDAGADVLHLPDTMGSANPSLIRRLVSAVKKNVDAKIEIHCHNDMGRSVLNSLAGIEAGADYVDTTVYGIGERNGIADMATMAELLDSEGFSAGVSSESLRDVYDFMLEIIFQKIGANMFADNFPVFGKNTSVHTAGTHAAFSGVFKGSNFSVNVYTGRSMVRNILLANGVELDDDRLGKLVKRIKDQSVETGRAVTARDIMKMAEEA